MTERLREWLFDPAVGQFIAAVAGIAIVYVFVRFLQRSLSRSFKDSDTRYRIRKLVTFFGYVAGIFVITNVYSDRLTGLTVAFGVAGAGIAFALQEVIASVAGWIAISFGGFYSTGQRVELGGIKGDVIDIGVLRTTLMEVGQWVNGDLYNGRIVRIANSYVFKQPVFNYSADFPFLWDEITVPIRFGTQWELARSIIQTSVEDVIGDYPAQSKEAWKQMVSKYRIEDASVDVAVTMTADQNWFTFTARYIVDYRKRRSTKDLIFTRIFKEIEATNGSVQIASSALDITAIPAITLVATQSEKKPTIG
jgi:small-conductance mechanosensitive channel